MESNAQPSFRKEALALAISILTALSLVATLVAAVWGLRDYLATKRDVKLLQCQMEVQIQIVDSNRMIDQKRRDIIALAEQTSYTASRKRENVKSPTASDLTLQALDVDLATAKKDYEEARESLHASLESLKTNQCEKEVESSRK